MADDDILMTATPSPTRRWTAIVMLVALAAILVSLALAPETTFGWRLIFGAIAAITLWGAHGLWQATEDRLELTREVLRTSGGEVLARVVEVKGVDRGAFAFKPSHGFLVTTVEAAPRRWAPGLWWRLGRRVGVGGTLSGGETRAMAEILTAMSKGVLPGADTSEPF